MRYRLRTLLIVLALGPPLLAGTWWNLVHENQANTRQAAGFLEKMHRAEKLMEGMDLSEPILGFPWSEELQHRFENRRTRRTP